MSKSEVAELRRRIELECEAIQRAMTGFAAGTARHEFIMARLNRLGQCREALAQHIGEEAAMKLVYELYADAVDEQTPAMHNFSEENEND
jgi:hypothetical protein